MVSSSLPLTRSSLLSRHNDLSHAFSMRYGGISPSPYNSLNLSYNTDDDLHHVNHNIKVFMSELSIKNSFLFLNQIHSDNVFLLENIENIHRTLYYDSVITNLPEVPLIILTADCLSVLLYDPVMRVIGAAHAGWRGTALGIIEKTVTMMVGHFFSKPEDIIAALGPAIGICCYEVDDAVLGKFMARGASKEEWNVATGGVERKKDGNWMFDLTSANSFQLLKAGLKRTNISSSHLCTFCKKDRYFSYRRDGKKTGRQGSVIVMNR